MKSFDGYTEINFKKPTEYDLVEIIDKDGRKQVAWWTGIAWDARKMYIDKPIAWKKYSELGNFNG